MTKERARVKAAQYRAWAENRKEKLRTMEEKHFTWTKDFDFTEPIKIGHHSERRHRKVFERRNNEVRAIIEMEKSIKRFLEKAENLEEFANRNKGDAQRRRDERVAELDKVVVVGSLLDTMYGAKVVRKINRKTYLFEGMGFPIAKHLTSFIR